MIDLPGFAERVLALREATKTFCRTQHQLDFMHMKYLERVVDAMLAEVQAVPEPSLFNQVEQPS